MRHWQDLAIGDTLTTGSLTITEQDIFDFAEEFDPQPYHLDRRVAATSIFGGLCASGWHVCAVMMRLLSDHFTAQGLELLGSTAVPQLRWRSPVFAGDSLHATTTIAAIQPLETVGSMPPHAAVRYGVEVFNQAGKAAIALETVFLIRGRSH